jgi:hypothetical protein
MDVSSPIALKQINAADRILVDSARDRTVRCVVNEVVDGNFLFSLG